MKIHLPLALMMFWAAAARAQPKDQPVALAVGIGGVTSVMGKGGDARVMLSLPRSGNAATEVFAGAYDGNDSLGTKAVYGMQWRHPIDAGRTARLDPFITFGVLGVVARYEVSTCVDRHCTSEYKTRLLPPLMPLFGAGMTWLVSPRVGIRFDYQAGLALIVPIGIRGGVSATIPLGRAAASPH